MTITERIRAQIETIPVGEPFTTASLLSLGTRAAVDQALRRLKQSGHLLAVSRGIYVRPKVSRFAGPVTPEPIRIAEAVAQASGAVLQPHGAEAARAFGLTTQVPTQPVYLTTGPTRHLQVGNLTITLRHTSPRKLGLTGRPGLALSALRHLGKAGVTMAAIEAVRRQLTTEEFAALRAATGVMPGWLADRFYQHERGLGRA